MSKFNVGDKVRVAADAGSENGADNSSVFFGGEVEGVVTNVLSWGYMVEAPKLVSGILMEQCVGEEWLTLINEPEEKALEPMVVGGTYWNPGVRANYTVTSIDFDSSTVYYTFGEYGTHSSRGFHEIEEHFPGYCAPVKPSEVEEDTEYPETVSVKALEEAADYLKAGDLLVDLLKLAKRLA